MKTSPLFLAYTAAGAAGLFVLWKLSKVAPEAAKAVGSAAGTVARETVGIVTGDNFITRNQTNTSGQKTTAYENAGVLGTLGGAFNSLSGGAFASLGESLGSWTYDRLNPAAGTQQTQSQTLYNKPPTTSGPQVGLTLAPVSFLNTGGSFKDLAAPEGYLAQWTTYGGGLSFDRAPW